MRSCTWGAVLVTAVSVASCQTAPTARARPPRAAPPTQFVAAQAAASGEASSCAPLRVWAQPAPEVFANPASQGPSGSAPPPPPIVDANMFQTENWTFAFQMDMQGVIHGNAFEHATGRWKTATLDGAPKMIDGYTYSTPTYYAVDDRMLVIHPSATVIKAALYDPVQDRWTRALPARDVTFDADQVIPLGRLLVAWQSGIPGHGYLYEPARNSWTPLPSQGAPQCSNKETALRFKDQLLLHCQSNDPQSGAWFDTATRSWRPIKADGAPPRRSGAQVLKAGDFLIVWGGSKGSWPFTAQDKLSGGVAYDVMRERWVDIPLGPGVTVSDDLSVAGAVLYWHRRDMLHSESAVVADNEVRLPSRFAEPVIPLMQTVVTTYDLRTGRWTERALGVDGRPVGLDDGRLFTLSEYNDAMVVFDPAKETVCRYAMGSIPFFAGASLRTRFQTVTARGDQVLVWGRVTMAECPHCPMGAPCIPCEMRIEEQRSDGVVLAP